MGRVVADTTSADIRIANLEKRLAALEQRQPKSLAFSDGTRVRVRIGLQTDGKFGVRIWNAAGTLAYDYTT